MQGCTPAPEPWPWPSEGEKHQEESPSPAAHTIYVQENTIRQNGRTASHRGREESCGETWVRGQQSGGTPAHSRRSDPLPWGGEVLGVGCARGGAPRQRDAPGGYGLCLGCAQPHQRMHWARPRAVSNCP